MITSRQQSRDSLAATTRSSAFTSAVRATGSTISSSYTESTMRPPNVSRNNNASVTPDSLAATSHDADQLELVTMKEIYSTS